MLHIWSISNKIIKKTNLETIAKIIKEKGYVVNKDKTKLLSKHSRHLITGIVTNKKVNVLKKVRLKLRQEIYFCKKFGVNNHLSHQGEVYSFYKEHLYGMAYYILMINKPLGLKFINQLNEIQWDY